MTHPKPTDWPQRLAHLLNGEHTPTEDPLDAGAELLVTDPDGSVAFHFALARHYRIDPEDPTVLWVRPVLTGTDDPTTGQRVFNLNLCRRRGLRVEKAQITSEGHLLFPLPSGQVARVQPASGDRLAELQHWDNFTLTLLTAGEEAALEALDGDSWQGRFG